VEVLDKGGEEEVGFVTVEVEERDFGVVVAEHGLHVLVVKVITITICKSGTADFDSY